LVGQRIWYKFSTLTTKMQHKVGLAMAIRRWPHPTLTSVDIASNKRLHKPNKRAALRC
jgi:hypothetical protein